MPEVSLVAILDADQEGFLRSDRSLIQTVGRAARHVNGRAIFYADRITGSMQRASTRPSRRREIQRAHNDRARHHAQSVVKSIDEVRFITRVADARDGGAASGRSPSRGSDATRPRWTTAGADRDARGADEGGGRRTRLREAARCATSSSSSRREERRHAAERSAARASAASGRRARDRAGHRGAHPRGTHRVGRGVRRAPRPRRSWSRSTATSARGRPRSCRRSAAATACARRSRARRSRSCTSTRAASRRCFISISTGSTGPDQLTNIGWDEIDLGAGARADRVAGARGTAPAAGAYADRARSTIPPDPERRAADRRMTGRPQRHARARRVDVHRHRRGAARRARSWPRVRSRCAASTKSG